MVNNKGQLWISWELQRRSIELSKKFDCELFVFDCDKVRNRCFRIMKCSFLTILCLHKNKPKIVFCQNPSIFLAFLLCTLKKIFRFTLFVDRHSNFMFRNEDLFWYRYFMVLSNYTIKKADVTIVTNADLREKFISPLGSRSEILPDALPEMMSEVVIDWGDQKKRVFFIASFAKDEPISEFFEAISDISEDYYFYISGNYDNYNKAFERYGRNYELTGFVSDSDFKKILNSVDAVMVFTVNDFTLTCGAYEGVSVEKPLILSDTTTIKKYFNKGCVYCNPTPESIKKGIFDCFENYDKLKSHIKELKKELDYSWNVQFQNIKKIVDKL